MRGAGWRGDLDQVFVPLLTYGLTFGAALVLGWGYRRLRGTTLLAPWGWTCLALATLILVDLAARLGFLGEAGEEAWRFIAASSTLCPGIALIGAKRPQNRAWQWIVASLWLIISLPAWQHLILGKSGVLEIHLARSWFMAGVVLFGMFNSLFSRYWLAVVTAAAGQLALLHSFLPLPVFPPDAPVGPLGIGGISCSLLAVAAIPRRAPAPQVLDRMWLDFRDCWGLVWSLRLLEQFNVTARRAGWDVTLCWSGFRSASGDPRWELPPDQARVLRQSLNNLLRRFGPLPGQPGVCEES